MNINGASRLESQPRSCESEARRLLSLRLPWGHDTKQRGGWRGCLGTLLHKKKRKKENKRTRSNRAPWKIPTRMIHLCRRLKFYFARFYYYSFRNVDFSFFFFSTSEISSFFQLFQTSFYFENSYVVTTFKKIVFASSTIISKIDRTRMLILHTWRNFIVLVNLLDGCWFPGCV